MKKRILVLDDSKSIRTLVRKALESAGYEVIVAGDGETGMRLFREEKPDLVITDIVMPGKEGLEVIRELRRDFPDIKIIAMSGGGRASASGYLKLAKTFGAQHTFIKPFQSEDLLKVVKDIL